MSANIKGKLKPKIKLVNVSEEEEEDNIIQDIKIKNPWINQYIEDVETMQ